jgi:hypothetical protein
LATLRDNLLPTIYRARAIAGRLGIRPHSVALVIVTTSGDHTGDGTRTESETAITEAEGQPPKVVWAKGEDVVMGLAAKGEVIVGPITPEFSGGGTSLDLLTGADLSEGQVRLLRISGPNVNGGVEDYTIKSVEAVKALRYMIRAVPVGSQEG